MKKKMILAIFIPIFSFLFSNNQSINFNIFKPIEVENNLKLDSYLGLWHQVATSYSTLFFGTGPKYTSVSAFYNKINSLPNTTNISVFNFGINSNYKPTDIYGFSYSDVNENPSKRKVKFDRVVFEGSYWIVKLGPIINNSYQYAVISGPLNSFFATRFSLYVLARNRDIYNQTYKHEVKDWCYKNGFIFPWNKYVDTY